ncbi:MAG TPA: autotransporter outer membrane beta-barrel domain-containing protein, partial [Candidatus Berkiella sp.]|nr:autotransporter outer membrane beta-barrel domain-containing protein [Candidatus Berkiella sp.]
TSLYFSHLALTGYNESGAGTASQSVDSHSYNMLKAGAGVRAAYRCPMEMPYRIRPIIFQPEVRMNAFYDFINDNMETTSNFTGGGPSFTTLGAVPAASSFNLGASLSVFSDYNDYIVTISYDFETKRDYNANAGFLRLRYEW